MWNVNDTNLQMTEGDYGIELPVTINGTTLASTDSLKFTFKTAVNGEVVLEKDYTNIVDNTADLELTEAESALFTAGVYVYTLDWYQNGSFMCNIISGSTFKVVDKA